MARLFKNNASGKLAVSIDATDTSLLLEAGQGALFPALSNGDYFNCTLIERVDGIESKWEIVKVISRVGDTLNIERGKEDTVASPWVTGSTIELRLTAGQLTHLPESIAPPEVVGTLAGTTPTIAPDSVGSILSWTLSANSAPVDGLLSGQSITLHLTSGSYSVTWPTIKWVGGTVPSLSTTKVNIVVLWKLGSALYGLKAGEVA